MPLPSRVRPRTDAFSGIEIKDDLIQSIGYGICRMGSQFFFIASAKNGEVFVLIAALVTGTSPPLAIKIL